MNHTNSTAHLAMNPSIALALAAETLVIAVAVVTCVLVYRWENRWRRDEQLQLEEESEMTARQPSMSYNTTTVGIGQTTHLSTSREGLVKKTGVRVSNWLYL